MEQHFVVFESPGTFLAEQRIIEIDSWDANKAVDISRGITERYGATPYGFYFITRKRGDNELDSHISTRSHMYYLGGRVLTLEDVKREMPSESILIGNMEGNGWGKVIVNTNSWKVTRPLADDDTVLDYEPVT